MRRAVMLVMAATVVAGGLILPGAPAHADHAWGFEHWYSAAGQTSAPPVYDRNDTWRGGIQLADDAARFWTSTSVVGTHRGSYPTINPYLASRGGNAWDCNFQPWAIIICVEDSWWAGWAAKAEIDPWGTEGHIQSCRIVLNAAHLRNEQDWRVRVIVRHEMGHCLGLGHTGPSWATTPVMAAKPEALWASEHDVHALYDMYYWHKH